MTLQHGNGFSTPALAPLVRGELRACSPLREKLHCESLLDSWAKGEDWTSHITQVIDSGCRPYDKEAVAPHALKVTVLVGAEILTRGSNNEESPQRELLWLAPHEYTSLTTLGATPAFLGCDAEGTYYCGLLIPASASPKVAPSIPSLDKLFGADLHRGSLRMLAHQLSDNDTQVALQLTALAHWHDSVRYCQRCSAPMRAVHCGWVRQCRDCELLEYPRQDPAVIVAVTNSKNQILLAHNALWADKRVSVLAGFVDAGETPETAVHRELREEVGLSVTGVKYLGSQPWPFPRSLMLSYSAKVSGSAELSPDRSEIEWAQWYSKDTLEDAVVRGEIILPGINTIAYGMISRWYGGELPTSVKL